MRGARIYLIVMAAMSVVFGVLYLLNPSGMMAPMGFGALVPSALTDVRATYGGFQIGTGLFMLWCAHPSRVRIGLLQLLLILGGIAGCRAIGLVVDGDLTDTLKGVIVFEVTLFVVTLVLFLRAPNGAPEPR